MAVKKTASAAASAEKKAEKKVEACNCEELKAKIAKLEAENAKMAEELKNARPLAQDATMWFAPPEGFVSHFAEQAAWDDEMASKILKEISDKFPNAVDAVFGGNDETPQAPSIERVVEIFNEWTVENQIDFIRALKTAFPYSFNRAVEADEKNEREFIDLSKAGELTKMVAKVIFGRKEN